MRMDVMVVLVCCMRMRLMEHSASCASATLARRARRCYRQGSGGPGVHGVAESTHVTRPARE